MVIGELQQLADIGSARQPLVLVGYEYRDVALQYVKQVDRSDSVFIQTVSMKPRNFEVIVRLSQVGFRTRKELHRPRSCV
ncbi:hypothetical protein N7504_008085 [Penicillium tannophilum]|nr:hypothetical protein N7504_008085 [Penicillium tannophilum]